MNPEAAATLPALAAVLFFSAAALFGVALAMVGRTWRGLRNAHTTVGTVVLEKAGMACPRLVVEYNRSTGEKAVISRAHGLRAGRLKDGDRVPVFYDPGVPERQNLLAFRELWWRPLWVAAGALTLALLGTWVLY